MKNTVRIIFYKFRFLNFRIDASASELVSEQIYEDEDPGRVGSDHQFSITGFFSCSPQEPPRKKI